jgi:membrane protease YdiL (CAAX protease family)
VNDPKRKKTIWYIVTFCVLVTGVAFIATLLGGSPGSFSPGFLLWGTVPMLVAFLMRIVTRDWSDAGFKPAIRKNALWYIISIFTFPVMMILTLLIGEMISVSSVSELSIVPYLKTFLPALVMFFIFAIFEEFGWRGYLAPKLASIGLNSYLACAITGVVWASWHLPYLREITWVYTQEGLTTFIPRFFLAMFAFSILYNELRLITGSVWPAIFLHCLGNSFGHPLFATYVMITTGKEYLVSSSGLFIVIFAGLLGIALNRWRVRKFGLLKSFI